MDQRFKPWHIGNLRNERIFAFNVSLAGNYKQTNTNTGLLQPRL
jgi:hypothetical protein